MKTINERMTNIIDVLNANKADNCETIDLSTSDYFADGVVLCTALNTKHTTALLNNLRKTIKSDETFLHIDDSSNDWIVIDMCDIIVHIATDDYRLKFNLDDFFATLKRNETDIKLI